MTRVFHSLRSEYALQAFQNQRLKVATLNELNDPFELRLQPVNATFYSLTIERGMLEMKQRPRIYFSEAD